MKGTRIENLLLLKVIDGDTVKVEIDGEKESLRLLCLDTEESRGGGHKPVTNAGKQASAWAKQWFGVDEEGFPEDDIMVDIEFDTLDSVATCLEKHRGNYGRLLCYVYKNNQNYNLKAIEGGWSPYFIKYGRSRLYNDDFLGAETGAQATTVGIWDDSINAGGKSRDYEHLLPWWHMRGSLVQDFRDRGIQTGAKSVRLDYQEIVATAQAGEEVCIFCDLQGGIQRWPGDGAVIFAGSPTHKFNLWVPDRYSKAGCSILRFIHNRYGGHGRGYIYVSGAAGLYNDKPQIVLETVEQFSDLPPSLI
jgi:micrococcal nuclease